MTTKYRLVKRADEYRSYVKRPGCPFWICLSWNGWEGKMIAERRIREDKEGRARRRARCETVYEVTDDDE